MRYAFENWVSPDLIEDEYALRGYAEGAIAGYAAERGYSVVQGTVRCKVRLEKPGILTARAEEIWASGWRPIRVECDVTEEALGR